MQCRVAIPRHGLDTVDEIHFGGVGRDIERAPCELGRAYVHAGVDWEEIRFQLASTSVR